MKIAIMQPYLFPYIGYFQLIKAVDKYIIFDDVNYIKRGWINRNRILVNNKDYLFVVNIQDVSQSKKINELAIIQDSSKKILKTISFAYSKAPYYKEIYPLLAEIFEYNDTNLANYVTNSIVKTSRFLGIDTEFIISSQIEKNEILKGTEKVLDICERLGASQYYNAIGGKELYFKEDFFKEDIELKFLKSDFIQYNQFGKEFIPSLSIIDVMMFNSPEDIRKMLDMYEFE
ncbi:MAG: WbqC family protein [Dysgonomonas sp.]|nr:WbqC family protein [Dysgonomonas sp.]